MSWITILETLYIVILIIVCLRIILDTRSTTKSLAYLLFAIFVPFAGIIFYFLFGINYRTRIMYSKKLIENDALSERLNKQIFQYSKRTLDESNPTVQSNKELASMLLKETLSPLTANNSVKILVNGENKFPEVIRALKEAKNHIHMEYYIYEDDEIGKKNRTGIN
jgi:cardiolipin synthase